MKEIYLSSHVQIDWKFHAYTGIVLLDIKLGDTLIENIGVLVIKDTALTAQSHKEIPGIIGMNCLSKYPEIISASVQAGINCNSLSVNKSISGFVKVAGTGKICIHANSLSKVRVYPATKLSGLIIVEPLQQPHKGLKLVPTVTDVGQSKSFFIHLINFTDNDVWIEADTRIAVFNQVEEILEPQHTKLDYQVTSNEIVVSPVYSQIESQVNTTETEIGTRLYSDNSVPNVDLTDFKGSHDELEQIKALLRKHEAIFVKDGEELSCTPTIRHKVNTVDDEPIQQRYRRIPPHQWAACQTTSRRTCQ